MKSGFAALALLCSTAFVVSLSDAFAQNYPVRPVRLIVAFAPGGSVDVIARFVGQKLVETWGQQVAALGIEPIGSTPAELAAHIKRELPKWAKVVQLSGARVD